MIWKWCFEQKPEIRNIKLNITNSIILRTSAYDHYTYACVIAGLSIQQKKKSALNPYLISYENINGPILLYKKSAQYSTHNCYTQTPTFKTSNQCNPVNTNPNHNRTTWRQRRMFSIHKNYWYSFGIQCFYLMSYY